MLQSVQAMRGLAACGVALMHSVLSNGVTDPGVFRFGAAGVDIFFVISGFIMATVVPGKTAKQFLTARLWRIYPLWWVAVLPWILVASPSLPVLLSSISLWPIFGSFAYPANNVGWTLCFEMLFYAALTLAILTRPAVPLSIFVTCFALSRFSTDHLVGYVGNPIILEFLMGVGIARLPRDERVGLACLAAAPLVLAFSPYNLFMSWTAIAPGASMTRVLWWGIPAAMVVYGVLSLERRFTGWSRPLVFLGNASYSIYLFHGMVTGGSSLPWPATFAVALTVGIGAHWLIEKPLLRLGQSRRAVAAVALASPGR